MGILNVTPDSFYDGGQYADTSAILQQVDKMLTEGATFIDVGAYSSRPGAAAVSVSEEQSRLIPIIQLLVTEFPKIIISVDTFRAAVAKEAIQTGASVVNDISAGLLDDDMIKTVATLQVPFIGMHMRGTPQTMKELTQYQDVVVDVLKACSDRIARCREAGINDIIIDPGFGFAKNTAQNFELLKALELFKSLDVPLLVGVSRKSMIYKTLGTDAVNALNGTTALHMVALHKGASVLRVHDVKEAVECITLYNTIS